MKSETININETAYRQILALKQPKESISEVIIRLCKEHEPDILTYLNSIPHEDRVAMADAALRGKKEMDRGYIRDQV
jgi:predicted CopG family antitoxin